MQELSNKHNNIIADACNIVETARQSAYQSVNVLLRIVGKDCGLSESTIAKYLTYMPTKEELRREIQQQKIMFELQNSNK